MKPFIITNHAIQRYMQRSGSKSEHAAAEKLFALAEHGIPIGGNRFYHKGWIAIITYRTVRTAYRPKTKEQIEAVSNAVAKLKKRKP